MKGHTRLNFSEFRHTVLVVTHQEEVAQMADRIIRIEDGKYQVEG